MIPTWLLDARSAFGALLSLMTMLAVAMLATGAWQWYMGRRAGQNEKLRLGRLITMFGVVLLVIAFVVSFFAVGALPV
jgi:uncharacterized membrane protein YidH (DUF202 family)